ncbi:hypothetical protein C2845_PM07G29210 [Panicum miliaceum]|uniref:Uncharacterized protein n=1 Tax=Panicum miliaceum TaxID=4540 RepID=A0A3L6SI54_PANMI|nr:hypothetical protein C2845_PM07G29210 [Panicum miliaceum]
MIRHDRLQSQPNHRIVRYLNKGQHHQTKGLLRLSEAVAAQTLAIPKADVVGYMWQLALTNMAHSRSIK